MGVPTSSLLRDLPELQQSLANSTTAYSWQEGHGKYLQAVERLERVMSHYFVDFGWYERLYSQGYWAVREMSEGAVRPLPLLQAESSRLIRWLEGIERELSRIVVQDEWDEEGIPRLLLDTSALVREGSFDTFDWSELAGGSTRRVRLIIPILVVREMDDLKDSGKSSKARPRLRKIFEILNDSGRGPAPISKSNTLELLMDPPGHVRLTSHDAEIVRRATYLSGRQGGPFQLVTGDYTMLATAKADGIAAVLTPAEIRTPAEE